MGVAADLATVCRQARLHAGVEQMDIATRARVSESTVSLFEKGKGWRRDTEAIVAAYEHECGLPERELWRRAARC